MLIALAGVLNGEELRLIRAALTGDPPQEASVAALPVAALRRHPDFEPAARPKRVGAVEFIRRRPARRDAARVEGATAGDDEPFRNDLAIVLFISDAADYDGGELIVATPFGEQEVKLPAGDAAVYPASSAHRIAEVTRGERLAAVVRVESLVPDADRRELLWDLGRIERRMAQAFPAAAETDLAAKTYRNLLRLWTST